MKSMGLSQQRDSMADLRERLTRSEMLLRAVPDLICVMTPEGVYLDVYAPDPSMLFAPREQLIGKAVRDALPLEAAALIERCLRTAATTGERQRIEYALPLGEKTLSFEAEVVPDAPGRLLAFIRDVSDRKRALARERELEAQLQQSQKMETVGRLAGGVAHDFNNLLTVILGEVQLVRDALPRSSQLREELANVTSAGERAAELISQLLAFARKQMFQLQVIAPETLLRELEQLLRRLVGEDIELRTRFQSGLWPLQVDAHQIVQVILNLAVNAREAMPSGGVLTLEAQNVTIDAESSRGRPEVSAGDYVVIAVSDTGVGMGPEVRAHIFEPFFTTKSKGTGLGLATSYGIVKQHGGHVWVDSAPGKGSSFKVYLPRATATAAPRQSAPRARPVIGTETVLVVEDDRQVRSLAVRGLSSFGFHVLTAASGEEALALAAAHQGPIHAVVTDVVMPNMSGPTLAEQLAKVRPEARVLFVSGYTETVANQRGGLGEGVAFLQKPFTPSTLAQRLRELLDAQ
jgi:signal transduction histidine kinase